MKQMLLIKKVDANHSLLNLIFKKWKKMLSYLWIPISMLLSGSGTISKFGNNKNLMKHKDMNT